MDKTKRSGGAASRLDAFVPAALIVGAVLVVVGFILSFTVASPVNGAAVDGAEVIGGQVVSNKLLLSQKIFYFHVPVAVVSFALLLFCGYYSIRYLKSREERFDTRAALCAEVGLVFVVCTMVTGIMWTRFEWGVWWTWEPRLTTYLVLMLLIVAYLVLRASVTDGEKRGVYSAVFGILILVDTPLCFLITRMIPSSLHPVVFRTDSGLSPDMLVPFLLVLFGMAAFGFALYRIRLRTRLVEQRVVALQNEMEL